MSGERSIDVELPATLASAGSARTLVRELLEGWPASLVDDAQLLVSELVTNAVLHAHTGVTLGLRVGAGRLRVEVADGSLDRPRPRHPADDAVTGRGLLLVDALSSAWGAELREGGKVVWFEVAVDAVVPPATRHDAADETSDRARTVST